MASVPKQQPDSDEEEEQRVKEKRQRIATLLRTPMHADSVQFRQAGRGQEVPYVATHHAVELANEIFLPTGWSSQVVAKGTDFCECENNRWSCGAYCIVRVIFVETGIYHEDCGYGSATNMPTDAMALDTSLKTAASDGLKRALRLFGEGLGNSVYDKRFIREVKSGLHRDRPIITSVDRGAELDEDSPEARGEVPTPGSLSARLTTLR